MRKYFVRALCVLIFFNSTLGSAQITSTDQWTWVKGGPGATAAHYGTQGVADLANTPAGRSAYSSWTDPEGRLYVFAGGGLDKNGTNGCMSDMWRFDPATNTWTWLNGSDLVNNAPVYEVKGVPSSSAHPGSRSTPATWKTEDGTAWIYGGSGSNGSGTIFRSDLWKYTLSTNQWTWVSGGSALSQEAYFTSLGVAATENTPGSREALSSWTDKNGRLWMFGGHNGSGGPLNDLWMYNPATNLWTAVQAATAGYSLTKPAPRYHSADWIDEDGNFWLYGGFGNNGSAFGSFSDLWKYNIASNEWTLVKGDGAVRVQPQFGTMGVASSTNTPGGKYATACWKDNEGKFWIFGGDRDGGPYSDVPYNDLWKYDPTTNEWTWVKGDTYGYPPTVFGVRGQAAPDNKPGGRLSMNAWHDKNGSVWVFGGWPITTTHLNELWRLGEGTPQPTTKSLKVNIYGGTNPYANVEWNNWNVSSSLSSGALKYSDATTSAITATLSRNNGVSDNGATYGGIMAPPEVLRYLSWSNAARTITLSGLATNKTYSLELYGSKNATGYSTTYSINGTSVTILTDRNKTEKAMFANLVPSAAGQIVIQLSATNTYNYINGFVLTEGAPSGNQAPVVDAGSDKAITLPTNSVVLNGSASDADGTIASYLWTKVGGPAANINSASSASTNLSDLVEGSYTFRLSVTDNGGATAYDEVQVVVSPGGVTTKSIKVNVFGGTNPYTNVEWNNWNVSSSLSSGALKYSDASASSISATLSRNNGVSDNGATYGGIMAPPEVLRYLSWSNAARTITLSGLATNKTYSLELYGSKNATGYSTTYSINGTSVTILTDKNKTNAASFANLVPSAAGQIVIQLSATNTYNYINGFILAETGGSVPNTPPTVNLGADKSITLPANSVTINYSATDSDGSIVSYNWSKASGPVQHTITPGAGSTVVSNLVEGTYTFRLTVTDNGGSTAYDDVQVVVLPAPPVTATKSLKVNLFGGTNPYNNGEWNNWNVSGSLNSGALKYSNASISSISAALSKSSGINDNGASYGGTMAPPEVLRYSSYSTTERTLTISGLSASKTYSLELYASRANTGNSTNFSIGGVGVTVLTDGNKTTSAIFTGLVPSASGQLVLNIKSANTYNYLNGFIITENDNAGETSAGTEKSSSIVETVATESKKGSFEQSLVELEVKALPNPSSSYFTVKIRSSRSTPVDIMLIDVAGKVVEQRQNVAATTTITMGQVLTPGIYHLRVMQGGELKTLKLVKMP